MSQQQKRQHKNDDELLKMEERSARYFKAVFEKMYYSLEIEKVKDDYLAFLQKNHPEVLSKPIEETATVEENGNSEE